jgi:hypothetical protein
MGDKKKRISRLIESYINDSHKNELEQFYGKGTEIKIHSISESYTTKSLMLEAVIILGDTINEEIMDRTLADVLIQDALVYIFPDQSIKTYVRWDA